MIVRSESKVLGEGEAAVRETEDSKVERMAPRREEVVTILACLFAGLLHQDAYSTDERRKRR